MNLHICHVLLVFLGFWGGFAESSHCLLQRASQGSASWDLKLDDTADSTPVPVDPADPEVPSWLNLTSAQQVAEQLNISFLMTNWSDTDNKFRSYFSGALLQDLQLDEKGRKRCRVKIHTPGEEETEAYQVLMILNIENHPNEEFYNAMRSRRQDKVLILGNWWNETVSDFEDSQVTSIWVPGASLLFAQRREQTPLDLLQNRSSSIEQPAEIHNTVVYQQTFCAEGRESFWDKLNEQLQERLGHPGGYLGICNGAKKLGRNMSDLVPPADLYDFEGSPKRYAAFRFVFAAEHGFGVPGIPKLGYITEKIIDVFLSGAAPIYGGSASYDQMKEMLNMSSFLHMPAANGTDNQEEVLNKVVTALQGPPANTSHSQGHLAPGAMARFFSWHPAVWPSFGDSLRKKIIKALLGHCDE